jgi:cytosine/adenosine deaminase-related metal-dependent hydrolase
MPATLFETWAVLTGGRDFRLLRGGGLLVDGGRIGKVLDAAGVSRFRKSPEGRISRVEKFHDRIAIPGLVQTHIHLCQTDARGTADDLHLLDWLEKRIFPYEAALTAKTLRASVRRGLAELLLSGTTCVMDMGTVRHTEVIAEELEASGIRAYFGKCLMDVNPTHPKLREKAADALREAEALAREWHDPAGRLRCAVTPRFLLSCSDGLLREAFELHRGLAGSRYHTHASENPVEVAAVRKRCGADNVEYLDRLGVVGETTCLAHCVQVTPAEVGILKRRRAHVLHCPSSNLKLASGVADVVTFLREGIPVSLGSDGAACNNRLDAWEEMRLASLLQKPKHGADALPARTAFELATMGGARALGWEAEIG